MTPKNRLVPPYWKVTQHPLISFKKSAGAYNSEWPYKQLTLLLPTFPPDSINITQESYRNKILNANNKEDERGAISRYKWRNSGPRSNSLKYSWRVPEKGTNTFPPKNNERSSKAEMRHEIFKNEESVGQTNQCLLPSVRTAKWSPNAYPWVGRKLRFYSKDIKTTSRAIRVQINIPEQNQLPSVILGVPWPFTWEWSLTINK